MDALISIIIPVYNTEKYLQECLDSVVHQTMENIEVICVNDCSNDNSLSILKQYAAKDKRLKSISFSENKSLLQARKAGVIKACGEYIMFLDSDDSLEVNACEKLYSIIAEKQVDILHFGTYVDALPEVNVDTVKWFEDFAEPVTEMIYGDDIIARCFRTREIIWSMWNKIYTSKVCKEAFSQIDDSYINMCEDVYGYFMIAWHAKSYFGINSKFYHYNYGRGMTGVVRLYDVKSFDDLCQMSLIITNLKIFLTAKGNCSEWDDVLTQFKEDFMSSALNALTNLRENIDEISLMDKYIFSYGKEETYIHILKCLKQQREVINELNSMLEVRNEELRKLRKSNLELASSSAYRIGYIVTFLPRKLRGGLRCYRENGFIYTLRRIFEKLRAV